MHRFASRWIQFLCLLPFSLSALFSLGVSGLNVADLISDIRHPHFGPEQTAVDIHDLLHSAPVAIFVVAGLVAAWIVAWRGAESYRTGRVTGRVRVLQACLLLGIVGLSAALAYVGWILVSRGAWVGLLRNASFFGPGICLAIYQLIALQRSLNASAGRGAGLPVAMVLAALLCLPLFPVKAEAWGNNGHEYVNGVAAADIPKSMPAFLRRKEAARRIVYLGPEPDRWRGAGEYALNQSQAPDHFIDLERLEGLGELPRGRYEYIQLLYAKRASTTANPNDYLPERVGFQPYITMEVFDRLKEAFRDYRALQQAGKPTAAVEQNILFYAGWLGHYVADGAQPLHTSVQYDGWTGANPNGYTMQKGIHARFETEFVDRNITGSNFASLVHAPVALGDPFHEYIAYLNDSHRLVEQLYALDKSGGFTGSGSAESLKFTDARLAAGAQMLLNLWYTAWLQSAK